MAWADGSPPKPCTDDDGLLVLSCRLSLAGLALLVMAVGSR